MNRYEIETDGVSRVPLRGTIGPDGRSSLAHPAKTSAQPVADGWEADAEYLPERRDQPPADWILRPLDPHKERPPAHAGVVHIIGLLMLLAGLVFGARYALGTTIEADMGGSVVDYALEVDRLRDANAHVSILGPCASACTMFLAVDNICVGRAASFTFHAPYGASEDMNEWARSFMLGSYPAWVRDWIDAHGGLTASPITMPGEYAARFVAEC